MLSIGNQEQGAYRSPYGKGRWVAVADQTIFQSPAPADNPPPILTATLRQNKIALQNRGVFAQGIDLETSDNVDLTDERGDDIQSVAHRLFRAGASRLTLGPQPSSESARFFGSSLFSVEQWPQFGLLPESFHNR